MKKIVITGGIGYIGTELCKIYSGESWNNKITVILYLKELFPIHVIVFKGMLSKISNKAIKYNQID